MKSTRDFTDVGIDSLLDESVHEFPDARRPKRVRVTAFLAVITATAIGFSAMVAAPGALAASAVTKSAVGYWDSLPTDLPLDQALPQHTVLLDKDGKEFARFFSENRIDVPLKSISPFFTSALVATEDARFYSHGGIDGVGIIRAAVSNYRGATRQGASTLTQQLVQNLLINNARTATEESVARGDTYADKLRELKYAVALDARYSKDEILTAYANAVYFGNSAYGVEAAAKIYFNTTAAKLTLPQAATLVGVLKGPSVYDPVLAPEAAVERRNIVITRLETSGRISAAEADAARSAKLVLTRGTIPSGCGKSAYPYYCATVQEEILTNPAFGKTREQREHTLTRGGITLSTALDRKAMNAATRDVTEALGNDNRAALGVATVVPGTGRISAVAQNRNWGSGPGQTEMVYATQPFQVGSAMKPIVLATALEQGTPASTRLSASAFYTPAGLDSPVGGFSNYGNNDLGVLDARGAIKLSSNTYFIRLIEKTGVLPVADMAARLGIGSLPRSGPKAIAPTEASLALGAREITPLEMANAYSVFAGKGIACNAVTIVSGVRTDTGAKIPVSDPDCHQEIAPAVADSVADALRQPLTPGGSIGAMGGLAGRDSGAKTGTTNDYMANWTVGITPQFSTAVWLGDPRGAAKYPLTELQAYGRTFYNLTGSEVAAPVWKKIMEGLHAGVPARSLPRADATATAVSTAHAVPDVRGLNVEQAVTALIRSGITPTVNPATAASHPLYPAGIVVEQSPSPGSSFGYRQQTSLTLSAGSNTALAIPEGK